MPDALHFLVLTVAGWVNPPPRRSDYISPRRASGPPGLEARSGPACPCSAASARPVATCATIAGGPVRWAGRDLRRTDRRCPAPASRLAGVPRALTRWCVARSRVPCCRREEKQAGTCGGATQREIEMLATPGACGVIGRGQVETQHLEDRRQEAFSLPLCRRGRWTMSRSGSAVSMARSAYCRDPPRVPTPTASQVAIAARPVAPSQAVSGPRRRSRARRACALTRWCVARGGGAARCARRQRRPCGAADGLVPPAPAAPDTRRVGPRRRAVPARG